MFSSKFSTIDLSLSEREELESLFFSEHFMMSYSGLNKLLFSPPLFYNHYILRQEDDQADRHMIEGSLLHMLLLTPEDFNNRFIVMSGKVPGDSIRKLVNYIYGKFCKGVEHDRRYHRLDLYEEQILQYLRDVNLHQKLTTDKLRIEKMVTPEAEEFFTYKLLAEGKTVISPDEQEFAQRAVTRIKKNRNVMRFMGLEADSFSGLQVYNELLLAKVATSYPFGLRGILDNMVVDVASKIIRINDLKKTSKHYSLFTESIEYYHYNLQAAMYYELIVHLLPGMGILPGEVSTWNIEFRFIVVDLYQHVIPILISPDTMYRWRMDLEDALQKASYHFINRKFDEPYEILMNKQLVL